MKAKKRKIWLETRQKFWDAQGRDYQAANKRPGSVKVR